jgi:hypothetical protein
VVVTTIHEDCWRIVQDGPDQGLSRACLALHKEQEPRSSCPFLPDGHVDGCYVTTLSGSVNALFPLHTLAVAPGAHCTWGG